MSLHHDIVEKLSVDGYLGRETFIRSVVDLKAYYKSETHDYIQNTYGEFIGTEKTRATLEEEINCMKNAYHNFYIKKYNNILGHYFRNLYHIFKFLFLTDQIVFEQKQFYANIIRAQLSNAELTMLFYNCFIENLGYPKFKFLVDKFDLLQNMDDNDILDISHISAFESLIIAKNPFTEEISKNAYV